VKTSLKNRDAPKHRDGNYLFPVAVAIFVAGLLVRLPLTTQSLWYDEMYTLRQYIHQPIARTLVGQSPADYSPNNHVLHHLLARLSNEAGILLGQASPPQAFDNARENLPLVGEPFLRLPSALAGSLAGIVLAWPLRRARPVLALLVALLMALHPWMIALSTEARGYALMLLLGIVATNRLPDRCRAVAPDYVLATGAMLWTVPVSITLIAGHAVAMGFARRELLGTWLRSALLACVGAALLYAPFYQGIWLYYTSPLQASGSFLDFVGSLLGHAHAGQRAGDLPALILPILLVIAGSVVAWRRNLLRPALASFGAAAALGILLALMFGAAGEVRFAPWIIALYVVGAVGLVGLGGDWAMGKSPHPSPLPEYRERGQKVRESGHNARERGKECGEREASRSPAMRWAGLAALGVLVATQVINIVALYRTPAQPVRDALAWVEQADPRLPVIGVYTASLEAAYTYGGLSNIAYGVTPADPARPAGAGEKPHLDEEERSLGALRPWAVVFYPDLVQRRAPELWMYIQSNYELRKKLDGRVSGVQVYRRRTSLPAATTRTTSAPTLTPP